MSDPRRCPQCSVPLPANAPEGLCPKCLLQLGFESQVGPASSGNAGPTVYQPRFIPPTVEELAARFPQLEILEEIGHGGMGVVYKARQKDLDRLVALKILRPDIEHDPAFAERFVREARALGKLSHPAIVTVYDFGRSDGLFFLVMEYVDGANLRQLECTGKLTPTEALRIVPAICEALQYAHDQGVVHRDIKPENILIDKDGRVKIADFGLAKMVGAGPDAATLTGAWHVMGTPHYMAPEQMQGAHAVDHRADIYSLGVVIYEMLTGELPVGRFPLPSQKVQVDVRLDEVVLRSLEREPGRRYQHASDVKSEIETISREPAATPSTSMPPAGWYYGLWGTHEPGYADWVRRRLLLWLPIFLILALVALLLGALAGNLDEPLFGMVIGSALVLFPMWLLLRKQEQEERRRPRADFEARTVTDDSGREAGLDGPAGTQTRAQPAQVGNVQTGREMTVPALTRHAFGFWSKPQPGYDRRVGWPVMAVLALWVMAVLSLIGLNLAGAPIDARIINVALIAGVAGLPVLLVVLTLAYLVGGRGKVPAGAAGETDRSAAATGPSSATTAPGTALIVVGVLEWIACWLSCLLFAVVALSGDRELPAIFKSRETLQVLLPVVAVLGAALSAIVILAGLKMKRLESRPFAIAGSILAMFVSPGNVIGLPIGLWALYQLTRPEVKAAFRRGPPQHLKPESEGSVRRPVLLFALAVIGIATVGAGVGVLWQPLTGDKFQQEPSAVPQSAVPRTTTDSGISQETTASTGSDDDTTADASLDDSLTYVERGTFRRPVATIADETVPPVQVAFSADGATLFALVGDSIYSWDTGKGASLGRKPIGEFVTGAVSVVLSPTGDALTLVQSDGSVELKDASSGQQRRRHAQGGARLALFAPDQRMLAVAEDDATLLLWDVGQPSKPATRLSDLSVSSLAFSADGSLLATGCVDGTVRLLEVASGDVLTKLGSVAGLPVAATVPAITCLAFSAGGDKLAAGLREGAVQIWNIATGSLETTFQAAEGLSGLAWSPDGTLLATASVGGAITTWQTPDADRDDVLRSHGPSRLRLIRVGHIAGAVDAPFTAMAATESYACLIQGDAVQGKTLRVVDASIPAAPRVAGSCGLAVEAWDVAAAGSCVYVVEEPHLRIVDVFDPTQPRAVGSCPLGEHLWNVAVDGRYAYVTDINSLRVVDVMDPTAPREVGRCEVAEAQGITLSGRYAYIACDIEGVRVVDISDPTAPREVGGFDGPAGAAAVAVSGKLAFVAGGEDAVSLWIADISDPLGPSSLGRYGDWIVGSVAALGEFALIAGGELDVVDVSDPLAPKRAGVYSGADQVMVEANHVYVLGGDGFSILRAVRSAKDPRDVESP